MGRTILHPIPSPLFIPFETSSKQLLATAHPRLPQMGLQALESWVFLQKPPANLSLFFFFPNCHIHPCWWVVPPDTIPELPTHLLSPGHQEGELLPGASKHGQSPARALGRGTRVWQPPQPNISMANAAPWALHSIPEAHRRGQEQAAGWGGDTKAAKQHQSLRHSQGRLLGDAS